MSMASSLKKGVGSIMVEAAVNDREDGEKRILEITVMDNGVGWIRLRWIKYRSCLRGMSRELRMSITGRVSG